MAGVRVVCGYFPNGQAVGSEDCLYLNIWRPATNRGGLPVIVFVHGGSNVSGYTADPVYDGAALAQSANAIVVTVNYRLDVLGFLQMPQLHSGKDAYTGNYALLDNVQALTFIQRNIAKFGGNAANVTLMGQSAGAINVLALLTAPQAAGLFHKIVPISGGISLASNLPAGSIPTLNPASKYAAQAGGLLAALALADGLAPDAAAAATLVAGWTPAQTASYLRGKDGRVVLQTVLQKGLTGSGPIPDGVVVPTNPCTTQERTLPKNVSTSPPMEGARTMAQSASVPPINLCIFSSPCSRLSSMFYNCISIRVHLCYLW